ncbi:MAG: zf-HC2 domain-containing protein [Verrucomicrobia bacterium]|nr:zf-HC2 domain-containing protein [Verrucomicrobiota bacterium]
MNCRKARKWISLDMDGELSVGRKEHLYNHIRRCGSCNALRDRWLSLGDRLRSRVGTPVQTAEAAWADVCRTIRLEKREEAWLPGLLVGLSWRWAATVVSMLVLGAALGTGIWFRSGRAWPMIARAPASVVEWVETGLPKASTMVYEDQESGLVVIWVVEQNGETHAGS